MSCLHCNKSGDFLRNTNPINIFDGIFCYESICEVCRLDPYNQKIFCGGRISSKQKLKIINSSGEEEDGFQVEMGIFREYGPQEWVVVYKGKIGNPAVINDRRTKVTIEDLLRWNPNLIPSESSSSQIG